MTNFTAALLMFLAFTSATACAARKPLGVKYAEAAPLQEAPRPPAVVRVPTPMPLPGQLRPVPRASAAPSPSPQRPCITDVTERGDRKRIRPNHQSCNDVATVLEEANKKASQTPDRAGFFNAVQVYDYDAGALYQVYSAPMRITMIALQPGEKVIGKPAAGDTLRWVMALGRSMAGGVEQQLIYLKPTRPGLETSMVVATDRRIYYLELHSFEGPQSYMAGISWRYPQDEIAQLEAQASERDAVEKTITASNINLEAANFNYQVTVKKGHPRWTPEQVFDDGRKTYIRFPRSMLVREAPALFVLSSSSKDVQLVNYRVKNEFYVVDRLFDEAELRVGQQDQDIVRITRK